MKILTFFLLILLAITPDALAQSSQKAITNQNTNNVNSTSATQLTQEIKDSKNKIVHLENEIFWLGLLAALGFILPLPLGFYHIYRMRELVAQSSELKSQLDEQTNKSAQADSLITRNEKLENEIKQVQEKFRATMKSTQEKHQDVIEKMKSDIHLLDLENKRISGILMLKEQVAKKSFPSN